MAALNAANLGFLKMYDTQKVFVSLIEVRSNTGYNYNINHYIFFFLIGTFVLARISRACLGSEI